MIELVITPTVKSYSPSDTWRRYPVERHAFADVAEAKDWLRKQYGKRRR